MCKELIGTMITLTNDSCTTDFIIVGVVHMDDKEYYVLATPEELEKDDVEVIVVQHYMEENNEKFMEPDGHEADMVFDIFDAAQYAEEEEF